MALHTNAGTYFLRTRVNKVDQFDDLICPLVCVKVIIHQRYELFQFEFFQLVIGDLKRPLHELRPRISKSRVIRIHSVAKNSRPVLIRIIRKILVHHVPCIHNIPVGSSIQRIHMVDHTADVHFHTGIHRLLRHVFGILICAVTLFKEPFRCLGMPYEYVVTDLKPILLRDLHHLVDRSIIQLRNLRFLIAIWYDIIPCLPFRCLCTDQRAGPCLQHGIRFHIVFQ